MQQQQQQQLTCHPTCEGRRKYTQAATPIRPCGKHVAPTPRAAALHPHLAGLLVRLDAEALQDGKGHHLRSSNNQVVRAPVSSGQGRQARCHVWKLLLVLIESNTCA